MQDPLQKNKIALGVLGKRINDLYVFDYDHLKHNLSYNLSLFSSFSTCNHVSVSNSNIMMWHKRFGHTSLDNLKSILSLPSNFHHSVIDTCLICAQAKQTRPSFPHSITHTNAAFDLFTLMYGDLINTKHMMVISIS